MYDVETAEFGGVESKTPNQDAGKWKMAIRLIPKFGEKVGQFTLCSKSASKLLIKSIFITKFIV